MYELAFAELMAFVVLGFAAGIFVSVWLSRILEVVHMWRFCQEIIAHCLLMCTKIMEDIAFLSEVKRKHMRESDFTDEQIQKFEEVDSRVLTNWKNSVILSLLSAAPPRFRSLMPFTNWKEAIRFLDELHRDAIADRRKNYEL